MSCFVNVQINLSETNNFATPIPGHSEQCVTYFSSRGFIARGSKLSIAFPDRTSDSCCISVMITATQLISNQIHMKYKHWFPQLASPSTSFQAKLTLYITLAQKVLSSDRVWPQSNCVKPSSLPSLFLAAESWLFSTCDTWYTSLLSHASQRAFCSLAEEWYPYRSLR